MAVLMPVNWHVNGRVDGGYPDDDGGEDDGGKDWTLSLAGNTTRGGSDPKKPTDPDYRDWLDLISEANSYLTIHFLFTYAFTLITLRFLHQNYRKFIRSRQLFSLELVHSIAARTVMVTNLPNHLRGERTLAEYFENMNLPVESVSVCREPGSLTSLIDQRVKALLKLENAWADYVGNPSSVEAYDPSLNVRGDTLPLDEESHTQRLVVPHRPRPTIRVGWFKRVDALEHLENQFRELDEMVKKRRRSGKFKATHVAFVTFETMSSAVSPMDFPGTLLHTNGSYIFIANSISGCACTLSLTEFDMPRPRTSRHCLG